MGTVCSLLEYTHQAHEILSEFKDIFQKLLSHFCKIDDHLDKHY